ncbi:MAG: hypothetical protein RJA81_1832 [Planctomycetota bacterium]
MLEFIRKSSATGFILACLQTGLIADDRQAEPTAETKLAVKSGTTVSSIDKPTNRVGPLAEPAESQVSSKLTEARQLIAVAQQRMAGVSDYTCTFVKQERIGSKLLPPQIINMKSRTEPHCIYFSFQTVHKGREAIYFPLKYKNKLVAHEGGWTGYLAGTMHLDPTGRLAMSDNRHPIYEAGLNKLVTRVYENWHNHLQPDHDISIEHGLSIGNRSVTLVQTLHAKNSSHFQYNKVQIYFDDESGFPIRFVGYDWPSKQGEQPVLVEDYQFRNLKVNVGLTNFDFDPKNPAYAYK